jgi:hypothetical protein
VVAEERMFGGNNKSSHFLREDQKSHPNCQYSQSYQSMCSNQNGKYQCEKITKILRQCPGERPVEVYRDTENGNEANNERPSGEEFGLENHLGKLFDGFFHFGTRSSKEQFPTVDSFLNDLLQKPPLNRQEEPFRDRPIMKETEPRQLLPPHKIPKGRPPLPNFDGYVNGPPESI